MDIIGRTNGTFWTTELPGEHGFHFLAALHSLQYYFPTAVFVALCYIPVTYGLKQLMKVSDRKYELRKPLILWNFGLALFSWMGSIRMLPELVAAFFKGGVYFSICTTWGNGNAILNFWVYYFVVSKIFELGDTLFIILRRRPLIFLHVYHHFTVLLMTWYLSANAVAVGYWFAAINYSVHSMMYTYYTLKAMRIHIPIVVSICITFVQSFQMVIGLGVLAFSTYMKYTGHFCSISDTECIVAAFIYFTYFILFAHYFYYSYFCSRTNVKVNVNKKIN